MKNKIFSSTIACKAAGVNPNTMRQWIERDWFKPTVKANGPGTLNGFCFSKVVEIAVARKLIDSGFRVNVACSLAEKFSEKNCVRIDEDLLLTFDAYSSLEEEVSENLKGKECLLP